MGYRINEMADYIEANGISIAIIAVPGDYAQDVADILVETPIKGILNFAPVVLTVPDEVEVRNVDLSVNLEVLRIIWILCQKKNNIFITILQLVGGCRQAVFVMF